MLNLKTTPSLAYQGTWSENKHYCFDDELRALLSETAVCHGVEHSLLAGLPWDDLRHIMQGWSVVRLRGWERARLK
jgi:hypothetical protein